MAKQENTGNGNTLIKVSASKLQSPKAMNNV
jgi:hypothetical protein